MLIPIKYTQFFSRAARRHKLDPYWLVALARQESAFDPKALSPAKARGLLQLMPATARRVARQLNLRRPSLAQLNDPELNIRLGSKYLADRLRQFNGDIDQALASYNAGPHRVDRWLPQSDVVDARIWIENIPFNETRKYVRRVMAAETIFHWRLTGETRRLSERLPQVEPMPADQRLASR